ncbi:MAG: hypothetical protein K0R38_4189 [Polyangiaceae bacterium]|nr:hypothetical protein [Polyangiaceae bacterium]
MHLERRLAACLCSALVCLVASRADAQPQSLPPPAPLPPPAVAPSPQPLPPPQPLPAAEAQPAPAPSETLEAPDLDTPLPPPRPPSAPPVPRGGPTPPNEADTRPLVPIRAQRRLALTGELGWNGLAGFGAILTYNAHPHVAFDLAGGFSLLGWKTGVRGRYNILKSNMTPFVGIGFNATSGLGEFTSDPKDDPHADADAVPFTLDVKASYLVQYTVGFDFLHKRGFNMVGALGYAHLLNDNNLVLVDGKLTRDEKRAVDVIFKGGLVISLAAGYAFE